MIGSILPMPEIVIRTASGPVVLDPKNKHLFAGGSFPAIVDPLGDFEIWGYVATGMQITYNDDPPFGKKRHRRGWCSL